MRNSFGKGFRGTGRRVPSGRQDTEYLGPVKNWAHISAQQRFGTESDAVAEFVEKDKTEPAVVGFFEEGSEAAETFQSVADGNRYDFRFAYTTDDEVRAHYKYTKGAVVLVYAPPRFVSDKYDKPKARYPSAKLDSDALTKFIYKKSLPLVGQKTWKSGDRYDKAKLPILTLFAAIDLEKNPKGFDYFANRLRKVAVDYVGRVVFNVGDKEDFSYALQDYDIELESKKDVGVGIKDDDKYYKMEAKFNVENLKAFVESVLNGEIEPKIKESPSYEDPEEGDDEDESDYEDSNVSVLTTDNFSETVEGKDAMLEFYAPWCGHCQALKPTYKELGDKFATVDSVVVGAMDATANDPPDGYDVSGYPTLIFKDRAGKITPYDGDRDLDSMVSFIKSNAATPITDEL
ncbi:hypothetical protein CTAYLR_006655 [Chrysophaeum taylorii]|uniref:protein disulfide-isomerase n=1 Tax=Chrysophaeum taylorii TaxID=2483200 RepID=A0AAD7XLP0_9STRA|nr:hypothetical protein CTAYLR_006655 [Chrysophaeum taylorii]